MLLFIAPPLHPNKWNSIDCEIRTLKGSSLSVGPFAWRIFEAASKSIFATVNLHSLSFGSWELLGVNSRKVPLRPTINNGRSLQLDDVIGTRHLPIWLSDESKLDKWIWGCSARRQQSMYRARWGNSGRSFCAHIQPWSRSCSLYIHTSSGDISSRFSLPLGWNVPEFVFSSGSRPP